MRETLAKGRWLSGARTKEHQRGLEGLEAEVGCHSPLSHVCSVTNYCEFVNSSYTFERVAPELLARSQLCCTASLDIVVAFVPSTSSLSIVLRTRFALDRRYCMSSATSLMSM